MLLRKPVPLWMNVTMFAVAVMMIPLIGQSRRGGDSPPGSLREFRERLSQAEPELYIVPASPHSPDTGVWVSERPLSAEQTVRLLRASEYAHRWQGTALCLRPLEGFLVPDEVRESWGELGKQIGPIECFGDPALLHRIHKAISVLPKKN